MGSIFYPDKEECWTCIDWNKAESYVAKLQNSIAMATANKDFRKVRDLQRLLTKSLAARLVATRKVAQENKGKRTAGIDGILWTTPKQKLNGAKSLTDKRKPRPV
jgi:RNA-directed DNA polymerase